MRQEVVKYTKADSLQQFLTVLTDELDLRVLQGHPARFEILTAFENPTMDIAGAGGVTVLVVGEDEVVEHIYTCTYRGLFTDSVFTRDKTTQKFFEEFHAWLGRGKLKALLILYLSNSADTELENALQNIEVALIEIAKEGNLLLGNLDLIGQTRQHVQYVMEEMTRFADEQIFVGCAERVRENIVRAKLCMFCKILKEILARRASEEVVNRESGGENGRPASD